MPDLFGSPLTVAASVADMLEAKHYLGPANRGFAWRRVALPLGVHVSRHRMRSRRLRQYRVRQQRRGLREIIRGGGSLVCAPDVYAAVLRSSEGVGVFGGVALRSSPFVAPGHVYAIAKDPGVPYPGLRAPSEETK